MNLFGSRNSGNPIEVDMCTNSELDPFIFDPRISSVFGKIFAAKLNIKRCQNAQKTLYKQC